MVKKWLLSLVGIIFLSVAGHAEDFLIIGDDGFSHTRSISRISLSNGTREFLASPAAPSQLRHTSFAIHQYNRNLYFHDGDRFVSTSLENPGSTSIVGTGSLNVYTGRKVIHPDENVFFYPYETQIHEYTLSGVKRWAYFHPSVGAQLGPLFDYDYQRNYYAETDTNFVAGGVLGDELQPLYFSPGSKINDVAIDSVTGIIYTVNEIGGLYSVNSDGSNPTFLGNSGVTPVSPNAFHLDANNGTLYLGHSTSVYTIPHGQVDMISTLCSGCADRLERIQYVVDNFSKSGDADLDDDIDLADYNILSSNFDPVGSFDKVWRHGDFNGDHIVDLADYNLLSGNFSPMPYDRHLDTAASEMAVPEPSTVFLALLGMLLISVFGRLSVLN